MKKKISCVIPVYNEAGNISELYRRLRVTLQSRFPDSEYELIFVDDGSTDDSAKFLAELHRSDPRGVQVIELSRNFGHHLAMTAGLDVAAGDFIVMMDGDLQDRPEEIPALYAKLREGYDVVYGERRNEECGVLERWSSALFNWLIVRLVHEPIVVGSTIFRMMTKQVAEQIRLLRETNRYLVGIVGWVGFRHASVPVRRGARHAGKSKYRWSSRFALAGNAIFSFSNYPLRLIAKLGGALMLIAFALGAYVLYKKIAYGVPVLGWSSLMFAVLIIGGIETLILGIIGEYVGRSYMEEKHRPLYVVKRHLHA